MAVLDIVQYPDPRLKKVADPVEEIDQRILKLIEDMTETMYAAPGIGLAATQVGSNDRVIIVDIGDDEEEGTKGYLYQLINPVITERSGEIEMEEGCLSIPSLREQVRRSSDVVVKGLEPNGKEITVKASGLLAVCFQHEIDHLDGILFIDRLSSIRRQLVRGKLKKLQKD